MTVSIVVSAPREQVFDYLQDIANHPEFTDHYLVDWHLTRIDSVGLGAGARFRVKAPGNRFSWGDVTFAEVERPHRIVEVGRGGKNNRVFRVSLADGDTLALKSYFYDPLDPRDRLGAEWEFLSYAWARGVCNLPEPIARDPEFRLGLYAFAAGRKLVPAVEFGDVQTASDADFRHGPREMRIAPNVAEQRRLAALEER